MADIKTMLSQMIQKPVQSKPEQPAASASSAQKAVDALTHFSNQLKFGAIRSNLNQPALPYTATKSWVA